MQTEPQDIFDNQEFRQFKLQRTNEIRRQHPQLPLQTITKMIKKQWSTAKNTANNSVSQRREQRQQINNQNDQNLNARVQRRLQFGQRVQVEPSSPSIQESQDGISIPSHVKRTNKKSQYIQFFKYYYDSLKEEHKNWNSAQLSKIIGLLWQKKKYSAKIKVLDKKKRIVRPVAGKTLFGEINKLESKQEKAMFNLLWKSLPRESKKYWKMQGANPQRDIFDIPARQFQMITFSPNKSNNMNLNSNNEEGIKNPFNFMHSSM